MTKDDLILALQHHRSGNFRQAEELYRQVLQANPTHADAYHMLGVLAFQEGRHQQAIGLIRQALTLKPDSAAYYGNLALAHQAMNQMEEAQKCFADALRQQPEAAELHANLANCFLRQRRLAEAEASYREALRLKPNFPSAHCGLGVVLTEGDQLESAITHFERAIELNPEFAEAICNLGNALKRQGNLEDAVVCYHQALQLNRNLFEASNNLGNTFLELDKLEEAARCYFEVLRLNPNYAPAHNNLGTVLQRQGKLEESLRCHRHALTLNPRFADAHNNLGIALERQDKLEEALSCYHEALRLRPDFAEARTHVGNVHWTLGEFDKALACFEQSLALEPNLAETRFNQARIWLLQGEWAKGWPGYEWRWRTREFARQKRLGVGGAVSAAQMLEGRKIHVQAEQGLGDTLHFVRYLPLLKERGARIVFECQPSLVQLMTNIAAIDCLVLPGMRPPESDVQVPLLSLPGIFKSTPETVPVTVPYLRADLGLVSFWRKELRALRARSTNHEAAKMLVGIAWQGNPQCRVDSRRSVPLAKFAPLAGIEGIRLLSLQKGFGTEQLRKDASVPEVIDLSDRLDETAGAFMDSAAIMMNLDLVISSDTAIAHLAGALGIPVWVALPYVPDWRWLLHREDTPWYPSMRLFRQTRRGQWEDVFERIAEQLTQTVRGKQQQPG